MAGDKSPIHVLVVEDEVLIRLMAVDIVEAAGYVAREASDAAEAISILESQDDIGILFTDIDMPGKMNGLRLAITVHDRWPPIAIIVTSGKHTPDEGQMPLGGVFVSKPYAPTDMVDLLHRMAPAT